MSNVNLLFGKPYTQPPGSAVNLVFSLAPDASITTGTVRLVQHRALHSTGHAAPAAPRVGTATLQVKTRQAVHVAMHYDISVWRGPSATPASKYEAAAPVAPTKGGAYEEAATLSGLPASPWGAPASFDKDESAAFKQAARQKASPGSNWEAALPQVVAESSGWKYPPHIKVSRKAQWEAAAPTVAARGDIWEYPPHQRVVKASLYEEGVAAGRSMFAPAKQGTKRHRTTRAPWEEAKWAPFGHEVPVIPPQPPFGYLPSTAILFQCPWLAYPGSDIQLIFGKYPCKEVEPEQPSTVIVPVQRVYIVTNNVQLRRVDNNTAIPTLNLSMSIDVDSWTWGFNATLPRGGEDAVQPGSDGTPAELEVSINGTPYRVLAENFSRDRAFNQSVVRVGGKGKSAMLGAPYAPIMNFNNASSQRTAQQLMNDALTINGASIGWAVNWRLTDWLVPAGTWAHQGTFITALNAIAGAAGAYIQPDPVLAKLNVLARYPTAPWSWGTVTPDFQLPSDVTTREGIEWVQRPHYNRVFVSGEGQGVLGQVTRTGTAGDIIAPMVTDALITHADAARQRGISELSDTGRQAHLSLRLPVLASTGVIQPGKFVQYVDGGVTRVGIVRSTSLDATFPELWQTLGVETHVA